MLNGIYFKVFFEKLHSVIVFFLFLTVLNLI
jgi:hypothetical protein